MNKSQVNQLLLLLTILFMGIVSCQNLPENRADEIRKVIYLSDSWLTKSTDSLELTLPKNTEHILVGRFTKIMCEKILNYQIELPLFQVVIFLESKFSN